MSFQLARLHTGNAVRVVNDRRRLPRVAWNGQAVIQTRRGEVRGVGLDLSADGMAVLAASPGKAKERVRVHMQLGEFPLLTDARVVRMTKRRDGYRWALRFDRMDERMRANLEAYVRQQLASAARVRQAQLYSQRLKGGALPTPPSATPPPTTLTPAPAGVPTPAPVDPRVRAGITLPPIEPKDLAVPGGGRGGQEPQEDSLDGLAEVLPQRPLEIELPSMAPGPDQPVLDIGDAPPTEQDVYVPYQSSSATDEAALLGEGPMTPAPESNPPAVAATPPPPPRQVERNPAEVLAPGVIEISDDEDLSLEDILAEVEAGGTLVPTGSTDTPVSDLQMPPKQDAAKVPTMGLGDVPVLDDDMGDEEETLARDSAPVARTVVKVDGAAAFVGTPQEPALDAALVADTPALDAGLSEDAPAMDAVLLEDAPALDAGLSEDAPAMDAVLLEDAPALDAGLSDDAPALLGAPMGTAPALDGALLDDTSAPLAEGLGAASGPSRDSAALALDAGPVGGGAALVGEPDDAAAALSGAPLHDGPALDSALLGDAPVLGTPPPEVVPVPSGAPLEEEPGLDAGLLQDAPALVGSPVEAAPALGDGLLDEAPALAGAPFSAAPPSARATLLPGARESSTSNSAPEFGGAPFSTSPPPGENSAEISLADLAPAMQRAAAHATEVATEPEPANPYATPPPSSPQPYIPVPADPEPAEPPVAREADAPLPSGVPTPPPSQGHASVQDTTPDEDEEFPEPPALLDPVDGTEPAPPAAPPSTTTLYADDAAPFDPYAPNPDPPAGAAKARLGSAPRALGELPPVVEGLYTPTSNPAIHEGSGAYQSASFEPFPSAEAGLYGGREDVTFEQQQGNPRQRLAVLQQDDKSTHKLAQQHDLFLGDIEGVTSGVDVPAVPAVPEPPQAPPPDAGADAGAEDLEHDAAADADELDFAELEEVLDAAEADAKQSAAAKSAVDGLAAARAEAEQLQAAVPDQELGANAPTSMHGLPELAEMAPTRPIDVHAPEEFTPAPHDLTPPPQDVAAEDHTPPPQELSLDDVGPPEGGRASSTSNNRVAPTYPEFNVIPDYDQPLESDGAPSGPEPAQSGNTIVASFEDLGLPAPSSDPVARPAPSAPSDFAVLPSFGGPQIGAGFTMVAAFDAGEEADVGASSTMIATAGDIEAWRSAGVASAEPPSATDAIVPPEFEEERTGMYTPAPGSLPPLAPAPQVPVVGAPGLQDEALTAMRVGRDAQPTGAGFELNPRGPAPVPVPSDPTVAVSVGAPGPSSRGQTSLDKGGRPGPPPKPVVAPPPPKPDPSAAPPLRGSGSVAPASPPTARRSLVEDALADLKRKTDSRRKKRETLSPVEEKARALAAEKKAAKQERRRRRLGKAELVDPAIADLYKAAMTDLSRTRD
ncbi:MAG: PilZ domain-containing protein [Nannocystales bacterium]